MKSLMKHAAILALPLVFGLVATGVALSPGAFAQEEPQVVRQEMMERVGQANGVMGRMVRGQAEYDRQAAIEALETIREVAATFPEHFPEGSETGFETEALPAIWDNFEDFEAKSAAMEERAAELIAAAPEDLESFQPLFEQFAGSCRDCHSTYRQ